ncbi:hypothetical protein EJ110_NYTH06393 [Nymphaea thermarum]|nr:hypothetical protein EJ110_NYTH06393 [Nymphaea thermarum]
MEKGLARALMMLAMASLAAWQGVYSMRSVAADEYDELQRPSVKPSRDPVKTFKTEQGDVVDCVHIYAQPAFDHPLLKDHVIKIPKELKIKQRHNPQRHGADKKDETQCPQGTIPILRLPKEDNAFNIFPSYTTNGDDREGDDANWWLLFDDVLAGYWPSSLFTYLGLSTTVAEWGGEILNTAAGGNGTTTQMGSGHPWFEDYGRAAFISGISCIDEEGFAKDPVTVASFVTNEGCNQVGDYSNLNHQLFFGGTNNSSLCF